jgi:sec-independent protein translocase protein TatB
MFDLGFSELLLVFVIALVVLGPTRLPGLVAKIGNWVGKARAMARQFREQLESEVQLEDLNRMTETRAKAASGDTPTQTAQPTQPTQTSETAQTPPPPPEFSGAPPVTDDTYSHAHADGDAPMPYTPEAEFTPAAPEVVLDAVTPAPAEQVRVATDTTVAANVAGAADQATESPRG